MFVKFLQESLSTGINILEVCGSSLSLQTDPIVLVPELSLLRVVPEMVPTSLWYHGELN